MSNDKWFDEQYKQLPDELPAESVDNNILNAARESNKPGNPRYAVWATAAVVVLSVSLYFNSTQQLELTPASEIPVNSVEPANKIDAVQSEESENEYDLAPAPKQMVKPASPAHPASGMAQAESFNSHANAMDGQMKEEVVVTAAHSPEPPTPAQDQKPAYREERQADPVADEVKIGAQDQEETEEVIVTGSRVRASPEAQPNETNSANVDHLFATPNMTTLKRRAGCEVYTTAFQDITVCEVEQELALQTPECKDDLQVPLESVAIVDRTFIHKTLGSISCVKGNWLVDGNLITPDP